MSGTQKFILFIVGLLVLGGIIRSFAMASIAKTAIQNADKLDALAEKNKPKPLIEELQEKGFTVKSSKK